MLTQSKPKPFKASTLANTDINNTNVINNTNAFGVFLVLMSVPNEQVINILMATQENSPVLVAQALDKVLEILKNSELYSPQFPNQQTKPDDQMASDLVSGLISVS